MPASELSDDFRPSHNPANESGDRETAGLRQRDIDNKLFAEAYNLTGPIFTQPRGREFGAATQHVGFQLISEPSELPTNRNHERQAAQQQGDNLQPPAEKLRGDQQQKDKGPPQTMEKLFGKESDACASVLRDLATAQGKAGKFDQAEATFKFTGNTQEAGRG